jgi:hypothetical protein
MKIDPKSRVNLAPRAERAILDQIRNDPELIARLHITPQELDALSKCALMGTLTCKQDMLFILRQIREAASTAIDTTLLPKPPGQNDFDEQPDHGSTAPSVAPLIRPEPDSLDRVYRRRIPEQFGVVFWLVALLAGLVWNGALVLPRVQDKFTAFLGAPDTQAPVSDAWYSRIDRLNFLLFWEVLLVIGIAIAIHLKSRHDSRRFKIRPQKRTR